VLLLLVGVHGVELASLVSLLLLDAQCFLVGVIESLYQVQVLFETAAGQGHHLTQAVAQSEGLLLLSDVP
jgi:hypothetical protein